MTWYQTIRGHHIFLRLPITNKWCANAKSSYDCGFGTCSLDGSYRNLAECPAKCPRFKPMLGQRLKMACKIIFWRGSNQ